MTRIQEYREVSAPEFAPVTPEEVARNLRITHHDHDELLAELIDRATAKVESDTGRLLASRPMEALHFDFPIRDLIICRGPVKEIIKIEYYAPGSSVLTVLPSSHYEVVPAEYVAGIPYGKRIRFLKTPNVDHDRIFPVVITYTGGSDTAEDINKRLTGAVILYACEYYLNADNQQQNFGTSQRLTSADLLIRPFIIKHF